MTKLNEYNVFKGVLIHIKDQMTNNVEISFIFKVNPINNRDMESAEEINKTKESMCKFFSANSYVINFIQNKSEVTNFDYIDLYSKIAKNKNIKGEDNELHKRMTHGTAEMIKNHTKGKFKHSYYIRINTTINTQKGIEDIELKHSEITSILENYGHRIEKMLSWDEIIRVITEENRFFKTELTSLTSESLLKGGFYEE